MKRIITLITISFIISLDLFAHDLNYNNTILRQWKLKAEAREIDGSFSIYKNGKVYIEKADHSIVAVNKQDLSEKDQKYVDQKIITIIQLNKLTKVKTKKDESKMPVLIILLMALSVAPIIVYKFIEKQTRKYFYMLALFGAAVVFYGFNKKRAFLLQSTTSPSFIDSAFVPFRPNVHTFWDNNYFHVESKGIPTTHTMMVGISNHGWQQQVPIPQCYTGSNSWSIPLNPVIAASPVPVNPSHFTRGAIAIAANGVPIFNPYTNTGVDALVDGQLDNFGGHCGRADDYHYHVAPLHLYNYTTATLPIAFALDGFAVYGSVEPDGSPMLALDGNHGHFGANGVYHYHGTSNAPYMIGKMVGQVTEDATFQIVPQAAARPVRPSLTPLNGALITACTPNAQNNGYNVTYTLNGHIDSVVYNWTPAGSYTFKYYTATGMTTNTYNGFVQCSVPMSARTAVLNESSSFSIFPNPSNGLLNIQLNQLENEKNIKDISIFNLSGELLFNTQKYRSTLDLSHLPKGAYIVRLKIGDGYYSKNVVVD